MGTGTSFRSGRGYKTNPPAKDLQQLLTIGKGTPLVARN
jgi:hypothetical protein